MANPEHLEILKSGVGKWNKWRKENEEIRPDFTRADLRNAKLFGADLIGATLAYADLSGANLSGADLRHASLRKVVFHEAVLHKANFHKAILHSASLHNAKLNGANLNYADLRKAVLHGAILSDANLSSAKFNRANLTKAHFANSILGFIDLSNCLGLETTVHKGPSIIDGNTTQFDYKNLPEKFLAGCGLNKWQIESIKLNDPDLNETQITDIVYEIDRLRNISPIQLFSLFISYSRKDESFVECLEQIFKDKDIRYWRDVHHMTAGPVEKQIDRAIQINGTVLLVLSKNSVRSDWVEWEISKARELEKKLKRHVICPVTLDDSWKDAPWSNVMMNQVKKYNILDFSKWEDKDFFQIQFGKLLKGLNIYYRNKGD